MTLDVMRIPIIEHFEQNLINLLGIGIGDVCMRTERVKLPPILLLRHRWQTERQS
jgi:hypothetical protein